MSDREVASFNITVSQQGTGPESVSTPAGSTVRDVLTERGIDLDTPVMVDGSPTTLDSALEEGAILVSSKPGKGAV